MANYAWSEADKGIVRRRRKRVCARCVLATDLVLGGIHSESECQRCGEAPCAGAIVEKGDAS